MSSAFRRRKHLQAKWKDIVQSFPFQDTEAYESISVSNKGKSRAFSFKDGPPEPFMIIFNTKRDNEQPKLEKHITTTEPSSVKHLFPSQTDPKGSHELTKSYKNLRTTHEQTLLIETMPTEYSKTIHDPFSTTSTKGRLEINSGIRYNSNAGNILSPTDYNNSSCENSPQGVFFNESTRPKTSSLNMQKSLSMYDKKSRTQNNEKSIESRLLGDDLKSSIIRNYQKLLENSRKESLQEDPTKMQALLSEELEKEDISIIKEEPERSKEEKGIITKGVKVYGRNADSAAHLPRSVNLSRKVSLASVRSPKAQTLQSTKSLSPPFRSPTSRMTDMKTAGYKSVAQNSVANIVQDRTITSPDKPVLPKKKERKVHRHRQLKANKDGQVQDLINGLKQLNNYMNDKEEEYLAKEQGQESIEENTEEFAERRRKELLLEHAESLLAADPESDEVLMNIKNNNIMRTSPIKELLTSIPIVSKKLRETISRAAKDLIANVEKNKNIVRECPFLSKGEQRLNELDIQIIHDEYEKKIEKTAPPNYERIDSIVSKLKFFQGKAKSVRLSLIKSAFFTRYESGSIIFKQGDYGDLMYIILRGSVNVRIKKATVYGTVDDAIVAVLYDGSHFGEYAMLGTFKKNVNKESPKNKKMMTRVGSVHLETGEEENDDRHKEYKTEKTLKQLSIELPEVEPAPQTPVATSAATQNFQERSKRAATIEVAESCELLCIPRLHFQAIFLAALQKELDAKVQVLLCLPFFSKLEPQSLTPLANNIKAKIYKMGDVLLHQGNIMDKLIIVSRGRCKAVLQIIKKTDAEPMAGLHGSMSSLKNFEIGKVDYKCTETSIRQRDASKDALLGLKSRPTTAKHQYLSSKAFGNDKLGVEDGKVISIEHVAMREFIRGEFFGGRGMLEREDIDEYSDPFNKCAIIGTPAKLSVVAESSVVEVFELPKDQLKFIPNFLLKILTHGLIMTKEFDEYDLEQEKKNAENWLKFKDNEVQYAIMNRRNTTVDSSYKKF